MAPDGMPAIRVQAILLAMAIAPLAAAPHQIFRSDVRTVPVYATVTRPDGELVTNVDASEFEIYDNGRKQQLTVFKNDVQPISISILLDNSPSLFAVNKWTQGSVVAFAHLLRPDDRACLGTFSHVVSLRPELTSDVGALLRRIGDDAPFPAGTALWDAIDAGRAALSQEGGRRVILVVTDAQDNCSRADISDVRSALERDGVMLYAIGIRGREGLQAREMGAITRATGGRYFELKPGDDTSRAVQRIADELHHQYVLGFTPAALDNKVHRIEVKVPRRSYIVRARRSYVASSGASAR